MANRTVQVHLNGLCNLSCLHCYSLSGPTRTEELELTRVLRFLSEAREDGYDVVSISGGEPFLYHGLADFVSNVRAMGYRTTAVSNGTVFRRKGGVEAAALIDFLAVSVDGLADLHNEIRGSPTAFERTVDGLMVLRERGVTFGIIHAVTRRSLPQVPDLAKLAAESGAVLFQLHPLGLVGAARSRDQWGLDGELLARAYLLSVALGRAFDGRMRVHADLFNRKIVEVDRALIVPPPPTDGALLSDLLNPLVLMANGDLSPICHGMGQQHRLGNINGASFAVIRASYLAAGASAFRSFCDSLWSELEARLEWPYFNWYEHLERASAGVARA